MIENFKPKNKSFLLFAIIQGVLWTLFLIIAITAHGQHDSGFRLFLSSGLELVIQLGIVYTHYLFILKFIDPGKHLFKYLLATSVLILIMSFFYYIGLELIGKNDQSIWECIFGVTITSVGILILSAPIKWSYDYFVLSRERQEILTNKMETELKYLRLQVNPHFLFNTLNNIYYLAQNKSDKAAEAISKLSDLMRYLLEKRDTDKVSLRKEIDFIHAYLELEKMRVNGLQINVDIEGEIGQKFVAPMIILPLIENAFKHGIEKRTTDNRVDIHLNIKEDELNLKILNSVPERVNKSESTGSGINNLRKRLELLYPGEYTLSTRFNDSNMFQAELRIPIS